MQGYAIYRDIRDASSETRSHLLSSLFPASSIRIVAAGQYAPWLRPGWMAVFDNDSISRILHVGRRDCSSASTLLAYLRSPAKEDLVGFATLRDILS